MGHFSIWQNCFVLGQIFMAVNKIIIKPSGPTGCKTDVLSITTTPLACRHAPVLQRCGARKVETAAQAYLQDHVSFGPK